MAFQFILNRFKSQPKKNNNENDSQQCLICLDCIHAKDMIQLDCCGVLLHQKCFANLIEHKKIDPGRKISLSQLSCVHCRKQMKQKSSAPLLAPLDSLYIQLKTIALNQLQYDNRLNDEELIEEKGSFYRNPQEYAMKLYSFHICFQCKNPYYSGDASCMIQDEEEKEMRPENYMCSLCKPPTSSVADNFQSIIKSMAGCALYLCLNDHPYFIGNCAWPNQADLCKECSAPIGNRRDGGSHIIADGNRRVGKIDHNGGLVIETKDPYTGAITTTADMHIYIHEQSRKWIITSNVMERQQIDWNAELQEEIEATKSNPDMSRTRVYQLAKQRYKQQGEPVIIDADNALTDIVQNAENYRNVALPLTLAQDRAFHTWDEQKFKREFSRKMNVPIECIRIESVRAGSIIIDLKLETHSNNNKLLIPIECIAENISNEKAKKALVEFGIFAMEFAPPTAGFSCSKQRVIMNPRWNREYGRGHTLWNGALNDGKSRGGEPYFCPNGWKRFSVQFSETAYDFRNVYDDWPIAYHGTKFDFSMLITLSGLMTTGGNHGCGVYLSPSIRYVSHPRYAKPVKLDLNKAKQQQWTAEHMNEFRKYNGKWIQCAFACRVKPGSFIKGKETMRYWTDFPHKDGVFDNIDINAIEWVVKGQRGKIITSDKILIYGIMIRTCDAETTGY